MRAEQKGGEGGAVVVERLSNLGLWELYRFSDEETDDVICKIALRPDEDRDLVEYGVWRREDAEPSATGSLERDYPQAWDDEDREAVLREIAGIYAEGLPETRNGLEFCLGELRDDDDDDEDGDGAGDE
ncbi:hypothetical protein [Polyangium aurulentum]|uniref:hypothetical protein n=1 Tax=Polyangium aurulentum TaxID=2567896 RepID=UPI0010ADF7B8|nr:hypothetical protein [Polyangium aurulentum]UQA56452.1 hypothetical protein E8A73_034830 [Polyangium aurulentum]